MNIEKFIIARCKASLGEADQNQRTAQGFGYSIALLQTLYDNIPAVKDHIDGLVATYQYNHGLKDE